MRQTSSSSIWELFFLCVLMYCVSGRYLVQVAAFGQLHHDVQRAALHEVRERPDDELAVDLLQDLRFLDHVLDLGLLQVLYRDLLQHVLAAVLQREHLVDHAVRAFADLADQLEVGQTRPDGLLRIVRHHQILGLITVEQMCGEKGYYF